jgi:diadenosine tetraphosphatase ApaH/serine/threonine PP2A family protein phosphatase
VTSTAGSSRPPGTLVRQRRAATTSHPPASTAIVAALRVAVISDVHANGHALAAVLAEIDRAEVEELWNLGDVVGYGPRPNEACAAVRERASISLCGNHDLIALGRGGVSLDEFNPDAAAAATWTIEQLDEATRAYLDGLAPEHRLPDVALFHASPFDPVWGYVLTDEAALYSLELTTEPLVLVGHSHVPIAVTQADGDVRGDHAPDGTEADLGSGRWLLNPGAVGQPRDGDPRAAYLLVDFDRGLASFRRVAYDIAGTQQEIRACGLPDSLARRLAHGA